MFAKLIGVAPSTISSWLSRGSIDYDLLFAKCERLSAQWLLTGKGDMIETTSHPNTMGDSPSNEVVEYLQSQINAKDLTIREQAEEIGKLKERLKFFEEEKNIAMQSALCHQQSHAATESCTVDSASHSV